MDGEIEMLPPDDGILMVVSVALILLFCSSQ